MSFDSVTLHAFLALAETRSFTEAAKRVGRTQSAVSQQMKKLEDFLRKKLFHRGKRIVLTSEGELFLEYAKKIFTLEREMIDHFREPELDGEIFLGLPEDFASMFLSEILVEFYRIHPRATINVSCDLTLNLFNRFEQKEFDLVILKMSRPEPYATGVEIGKEALVWVSRERELFFKKPTPLVLSPPPCVYRKRAITALDNVETPWRMIFSSYSFASRMAAVEAGLGVTVLPKNMVPSTLVVLENAPGFPSLETTHISLLRHSTENFLVASFAQFVQRKFKKNDI